MSFDYNPVAPPAPATRPTAVSAPPEPSERSPRLRDTFQRAMDTEGSRGVAARMSVFVRWVGQLLTIVACSAITHAAFSYTPDLKAGGMLMLASVAVMFLTATFGTMAYANNRDEILDQLRHFTFGIVVFPGTGISLLQWVLHAMNLDPTGEDLFIMLLSNALPIVYVITVFIPMAVFIKTIAGMRTLRRGRLDDEEEMSIWTRQDGLQQ